MNDEHITSPLEKLKDSLIITNEGIYNIIEKHKETQKSIQEVLSDPNVFKTTTFTSALNEFVNAITVTNKAIREEQKAFGLIIGSCIRALQE